MARPIKIVISLPPTGGCHEGGLPWGGKCKIETHLKNEGTRPTTQPQPNERQSWLSSVSASDYGLFMNF